MNAYKVGSDFFLGHSSYNFFFNCYSVNALMQLLYDWIFTCHFVICFLYVLCHFILLFLFYFLLCDKNIFYSLFLMSFIYIYVYLFLHLLVVVVEITLYTLNDHNLVQVNTNLLLIKYRNFTPIFTSSFCAIYTI